MASSLSKRFHIIAVLMIALFSVILTSSAMARGGFGGRGGFYGRGFFGGGFGYYPYWYGYGYPFGYGYPYGYPYGYGYYGPGPGYGYSSGCYVQHRPIYSKRKQGHIIGYKNVRVCPTVVQ